MLILVDHVTKRFGGLLAINNVSINIEEGRIYGLIGPNGAGKTTLLNIIAGAEKPNSGKIVFNGNNITGWRPEQMCSIGISRTFQIPRKFRMMNVLENVLVAATFGRPKIIQNPKEAAENSLKFVNFPLSLETRASKLNTSELKRMDLARAIVTKPKLILLDEPASGLTPSEIDDLMKIIREIHNLGVTIILVEHLMKVVMNICDWISVLNYGELVAEGEPAVVSNNPKVIQAYLGEEYLHNHQS